MTRYASRLGGLALLALGACGDPGPAAPPPSRALDLAALWSPPEGPFEVEIEIGADEWEPSTTEGWWSAALVGLERGFPAADGVAPRLEIGTGATRDGRFVAPSELTVGAPAGAFSLIADTVWFHPPEGAVPAARLVRGVAAGGRTRERRDGRWRVALGKDCGAGLPLAPGRPAVLEVPVTPDVDRELVFRPKLVPAAVASATEPRGVRLRVVLGEQVLFDETRDPGTWNRDGFQRAPWPDGAGGTLRFEVEGPAGSYALFAPRLVPSTPAPEPRPDLVLFLADTFRADNLAVYGGEWGTTPHLDRFAEEALVFRNAWASAGWTLPSQTSMLFGVHPFEHGATSGEESPVAGLPTLAERLAEAGYRTVAVTEGVFISRTYGLDRGFELFHEDEDWDVEHTLDLAREALEYDDGRPLFLFVHTYRAHSPYRVSEETRRTHGERLGLRSSWDELEAQVMPLLAEDVKEATGELPVAAAQVLRSAIGLAGEDWPDELEETARAAGLTDLGEGGVVGELERQYRAASADLDLAFERFLGDLERSGRGARAYTFFTSDHGEAFGEHGRLFHGGGPWDEGLRVPLLVRVPEAERARRPPARIDVAASLVDLPATFSELAGVAPAPEWRGRALLSNPSEETVLVFDCAREQDGFALAIDFPIKRAFPVEEDSIRGEDPLHAFDLAADPNERSELDGERRAAPEGTRALLIDALQRRGSTDPAGLSAERKRLLRRLGYLDESGDGGSGR